jgi:sugar lactone lactonase YvrE
MEGQPDLVADLVVDGHTMLGEGPVWDDRANVLWWVDIAGGFVHRFHPETDHDTAFDVGSAVSAVLLTETENPLLAVPDGIATLDVATGAVSRDVVFEPVDPSVRCNDAKVGPDGAIWAGIMALDERADAGSLVRVTPDRAVTPLLTGLTIPNGLDWPDAESFLFIDSALPSVQRFEVGDDGHLIRRGTAADVPSLIGVLDGMTLDGEGHFWVGVWDGWCILRISPEGEVVRRIPIPAARVTSCAFGGTGLDELYITTAAEGVSESDQARQPNAGGLFRLRPGVTGRPPHRFPGWST